MKTKHDHVFFFICLIVAMFFFALFSQEARALPSKSDIVNKMILVNDYWINGHLDSGDNKWARAVYFIGNMAMYDMYPDSKYYKYAEDWAIKWDWKLNGYIWQPNADDQAAGQTYIALYKHNPQSYKIEHIQTSVNNMVNSSNVESWWWVDALFMAMPNFVELGNINFDTAFHDKMWDLYAWTKYSEGGRGLYSDNGNNNGNNFLWWRDKNQTPPNLTSTGKNIYWSRGNGWVIAAMVKVLKELPVSDSHYEEYKQTLISMAGSLKDRQRPDGFWSASLDDPSHYGGKETSGTAFFTYALAYGINVGILEAATYRPVVEKAWNGMVNDAVQASGLLGYIQGPGHAPESNQPVNANSTRDFGVGAFLLAGTEVVKMASGVMPDPENPPPPPFPVVVSQSSEQVGKEAIKVIDGNTSDDFLWSASGFPQWVIIDYGENKSIEGAELWTYQNRAYQYYVYASTSLADVENEVAGSLIVDHSNNTSTSQPILSSFATLEARYVKLKIVGASGYSGSWSSINEFKIVEGNFTPLPSNKVIYSQSSEQAGNEAIKVIDGNTSNDFRWSASGFPQWVIIDYGENKSIEGTELWTYQNRAYQYYVYASTSLADVENEVAGSLIVDHSNNTSTSQPILSSFATLEARYVKLKIVGASGYSSSWSSINEFKIVEGDSTGLDAAVLSLDLGIKQLQFSWPAVQNATYYRLMENPDGVSGFTQRGADITTTSHTLDIAVHRQDWGNARYLLQACNSQLCSDSNEVSTLGGVLSAIGYVKASNTQGSIDLIGGGGFGESVVLSGDGNTLAVGTTEEFSDATGVSNGGTGWGGGLAMASGAVYVFSRNGGSWFQQAYIKASNTGALDFFGASVALSNDGNTLAVSARGESSNARGVSIDGTGEEDNSAGLAGAVYVFSRNGGSWSQQAYVKASNTEAFDRFGTSVALSDDGNTLAVGASDESSNATSISMDGTGEEDNSAIEAGAVYVFSRSGSSWLQQAYVKASNAEKWDFFGGSVDLSSDGNTLAVGAWRESSNATGISTNGSGEADNSAEAAGAAYVFGRNGGSWFQQAYVKASNAEAGDFFGGSVDLSGDGNTLVVGASGEDSNATGISTDGTGETDNSTAYSGAVYVFSRNGGSWSQQAYVKASNNAETSDSFGDSVALSGDGNTLVVGADREKSNATGISTDGSGEGNNSTENAGAVYVFNRSGGSWFQQTYVKASNTGTWDFFGTSVSVNNDGNILAIGASGEDSNAIGITHGADAAGADNSATIAGAVYLY